MGVNSLLPDSVDTVKHGVTLYFAEITVSNSETNA